MSEFIMNEDNYIHHVLVSQYIESRASDITKFYLKHYKYHEFIGFDTTVLIDELTLETVTIEITAYGGYGSMNNDWLTFPKEYLYKENWEEIFLIEINRLNADYLEKENDKKEKQIASEIQQAKDLLKKWNEIIN